MLAQYDTILLDADRTLFDTAKTEEVTLREMMERIGAAYVPSMLTDYVTLHEELWRQLERGEVTRDFVRHERFRRLLRQYHIDYDSDRFNAEYVALFPVRSTLMAGALEVCRTLSKTKRLAIITNGSERVQRIRFGRASVTPYLERIFSSEVLGVSKPDPAFFSLVLQKMGISNRDRVLIVGDSLTSDILGGQNAGIDTCWFHPEPAQRPPEIVCRYEISDLRQLLEIP